MRRSTRQNLPSTGTRRSRLYDRRRKAEVRVDQPVTGVQARGSRLALRVKSGAAKSQKGRWKNFKRSGSVDDQSFCPVTVMSAGAFSDCLTFCMIRSTRPVGAGVGSDRSALRSNCASARAARACSDERRSEVAWSHRSAGHVDKSSPSRPSRSSNSGISIMEARPACPILWLNKSLAISQHFNGRRAEPSARQ
jgi:hypothetical protein